MKLFDTSIAIEHIKKGVFEKGAISVITLIEILRGVASEKRARVKELLEKVYSVIDISNNAILKYCELYSQLKERGEVLSDADLLIAATAIAHDFVLVTKDKDFQRIANYGLKLELRT
jgi:predicted nucleic acid-binding protein